MLHFCLLLVLPTILVSGQTTGAPTSTTTGAPTSTPAPLAPTQAPTAREAGMGGCNDGITCGTVEANGLTFDCRFSGADTGTPVMLLHGFPEWSSHYNSLMKRLALDGDFYCVACNQRGYSPGARPPNKEDYKYTTLADDVWKIAAELGFDEFHLIGHDHGAALAWTVASTDDDYPANLLSVTAMAVPHPDAFSAGLYGPDADVDQQMASQYFRVFVQEDSSANGLFAFFNSMPRGLGLDESWDTAEDFQKAVWWYNGMFEEGLTAIPPYVDTATMGAAYATGLEGPGFSLALRTNFPVFVTNDGETVTEGAAATTPVGTVPQPTLFVCGNLDPYLLCANDFALKSEDYVTGPYTYLSVACDHNIANCEGADGEEDHTEREKVHSGILSHLCAASPEACCDQDPSHAACQEEEPTEDETSGGGRSYPDKDLLVAGAALFMMTLL